MGRTLAYAYAAVTSPIEHDTNESARAESPLVEDLTE
jgi:hypothetical protein